MFCHTQDSTKKAQHLALAKGYLLRFFISFDLESRNTVTEFTPPKWGFLMGLLALQVLLDSVAKLGGDIKHILLQIGAGLGI